MAKIINITKEELIRLWILDITHSKDTGTCDITFETPDDFDYWLQRAKNFILSLEMLARITGQSLPEYLEGFNDFETEEEMARAISEYITAYKNDLSETEYK